MVIRSTVTSWVVPEASLTGPRRPVVRDVVAPQVQLVPDALLVQEMGEVLRALQRARGVLPHALAADEQEARPRADPVEVVAVHRPHLAGDAELVVARHGDGRGEEVGAAQHEIDGVERAHAAAGGEDVLVAALVVVDERRHLVDHPRLVGTAVAGVERVDAVELAAAGLEQAAELVHHALAVPVVGAAALGGEDEDRTAVVAVDQDVACGADGGRVELGVSHQTSCSSRVRCGSKASRQAV
jgi:hypothetical protein